MGLCASLICTTQGVWPPTQMDDSYGQETSPADPIAQAAQATSSEPTSSDESTAEQL